MPARHVAPRHRAPRSLKRSVARLASDAGRVLPSSAPARTVVALATAGALTGVGVLSVDASPRQVESAPEQSSAALRSQTESILAAHASAEARAVSRSALRPPVAAVQRATKSAALPVRRQALGGAVTTDVPPASPQQIAMSMLGSYGWDSSQFSCLDAVWIRESNWDPYAENSSSGAYGIPQSLPASKMAAFGSDYSTNPTTQIKWGLWYIQQSYGSPCGAWSFWQSHNWY